MEKLSGKSQQRLQFFGGGGGYFLKFSIECVDQDGGHLAEKMRVTSRVNTAENGGNFCFVKKKRTRQKKAAVFDVSKKKKKKQQGPSHRPVAMETEWKGKKKRMKRGRNGKKTGGGRMAGGRRVTEL